MKTNYEYSPAVADFVSAALGYAVATAYGNIIQRRDALKLLETAKRRFRYQSSGFLNSLRPLLDELERIRDAEVT